MIKRKKFLFYFLIAALIFTCNFWWSAQPILAAATTLNFGGKITWITYCCNGLALTVGPPKPGIFLFTAGSILHAYYQIYRIGPWVLGSATPGGFCEDPLLMCAPIPVTGTIFRLGTSKF